MKKLFIALTILLFALSNSAAIAEQVMFNTSTLKYHKLSCKWAKKCTVNCIKIDKKEAKRRGGTPCKVCGG